MSKYGDELSIYATPERLSLSATNSSKSAYCRIKYEKEFFTRYRVADHQEGRNDQTSDNAENFTLTGQLLTKSLLSILRHRTIEKAVERCELSIVEGEAGNELGNEGQDGLESRLIVRLHCKHGVVKTHRLLLLTPTSLMAPGVPNNSNESRLTIGPKALKDMIEHFPVSKGVKADPQLVWSFGNDDVALKSLESSIDSRGKGQLSTELTISAEEFEVYAIDEPPTTIAFHLREFNATIAYADSMSLGMELRFTDPAAPLFIDVEGDCSEALFVISTSHVSSAGASASNHRRNVNTKKREREETPGQTTKIKRSMRVVQPSLAMERDQPNANPEPQSCAPSSTVCREFRQTDMPPPSSFPDDSSSMEKVQEPLFLPSSSQLSAVDEAVLRASGLEVGTMDELTEMLEGEGEEVVFGSTSQPPDLGQRCGFQGNGEDRFEIIDDTELGTTQSSYDRSKMFQPLFED